MLKMEDDNQPGFSVSVPDSFPINYASIPGAVALVEQPWEQQEESNKDEVTELTATIQELAIESGGEDDDNHERDDEPPPDEDSQLRNLRRPLAISNAILDSDEDLSHEVDKADSDAGMWLVSRRKSLCSYKA